MICGCLKLGVNMRCLKSEVRYIPPCDKQSTILGYRVPYFQTNQYFLLKVPKRCKVCVCKASISGTPPPLQGPQAPKGSMKCWSDVGRSRWWAGLQDLTLLFTISVSPQPWKMAMLNINGLTSEDMLAGNHGFLPSNSIKYISFLQIFP